MKRVIQLAKEKSFAGSRDYGIEVRTRILEALEHDGTAVVDLAGVEDMTPSFADECFGKLSEQLGVDVREKVEVLNADAFRSLLDAVIRTRLQRMRSKQPPRSI